jgi:putative SOS response-associated peptidase YedK
MRRRRCLVPTDGFYGWREVGGPGQAYFVRRRNPGEPFAFAGLWETWTGPNGEELDTAAIVTTDASRTLAAINQRMPVILPPEAFDLWLDCAEVDAKTAAALLAATREDLLEAYEVSPAVNRVANDSEALIARLPQAHDARAPATEPVLAEKAKKVRPNDQPTLFWNRR